MGAIRTDPSQTKTVIALVGVLAVALGVTIVRLKPAPATDAAPKQEAAASPSRSACAADDPECDRSRNPFGKPAPAKVSGSVNIGESQIRGIGTEVKVSRLPGGRPLHVEPFNLDPMLPGLPGKAKPGTGGLGQPQPGQNGSSTQAAADAQKTPRSFVLLATVRSARGYSAVIRTGEPSPRVVEVGDVLDGGFKVVKLAPDRAVLTNGKEVIIVKRPQP